MSSKKWNLEALKSALRSDSRIKGWIVTEENTARRERYFLSDSAELSIDQDRETRSQAITLQLMVKLEKAGKQGEITQRLFTDQTLEPQLAVALEAASGTEHQEWSLPAPLPQNEIPLRVSCDPAIAEDLESSMDQLTSKISAAVATRRPTPFNSAELFVSVHDRALHLSNGLTHRSSQSRIYAEAAYSMAGKDSTGAQVSDEFLETTWAVGLRDLDIEKLFDDCSQCAENSVQVSLPDTGKYAVVIDASSLAALFGSAVSQLSSSQKYNRLPFLEPGSELIPAATGDLITLSLDPTLELGGDTTALSDSGLLQTPLELVKDNRVLTSCTDQRYAQYLGCVATPSRGSLVIKAGTAGYDELTKSAPVVIEVLQFSSLLPDPNSGTFSSEIRLAKLHDNVRGEVRYIKGGCLSGSIRENFKSAQFSNTQVRRAHFSSGQSQGFGYFGPSHALIRDVSIVGV